MTRRKLFNYLAGVPFLAPLASRLATPAQQYRVWIINSQTVRDELITGMNNVILRLQRVGTACPTARVTVHQQGPKPGGWGGVYHSFDNSINEVLKHLTLGKGGIK
jgi:hypothetical protein